MAKDNDILVTTTPGFEGRRIVDYKGLVGGDAILGANLFRDLFAGLRDLVGGRSGSYEKVLRAAKTEALEDMMAAARERGEVTLPTTIGEERATNPFMRAQSVEELARLRSLKDSFG